MEETVTQGSRTESTHYVWGTNLIKQTRSGQGSYYHADAQGSVKALTDDSGNATDSYEYSAFGELTSHTGTTENPHRYTGEDYDETVGLQYNRARWYDASVGRWLSLDPHPGRMGQPGTLNKYVYVGNEPLGNRDPSGRMSLAETSAAQDIQGILVAINRVDNILSFYGKAHSVVDLVFGLRQLLTMFDGDLTGSIPRHFPPRVDFADAAQAFIRGGMRAFAYGSPNWLSKYVVAYMKGDRLTSYVLYMPVLVPQIPSLTNTPIKIQGKPVKIGLGAPRGKFGSLGGIGVVMGKERALFRMDLNLTPSGHKQGSDEIEVFDEPPYSFHVYDFDRGGRG